MPARRKGVEPQTPPTTPPKTRSKRNGSGSSLGSSISSTGSQRFTAYLKERPSASSSIYSPEENPFSREDEIFGQIQLANSQPIDDDDLNNFVPLPTTNTTTDRGIINTQDDDNNNNNRPGLLMRGLNFFIGLLAKSLNLIGFTIFFLFWCIKKSMEFVWNNLNGPFSDSISTATVTPVTPVTTTATTTISVNNNNNNDNKRNRWLTYLLLFAIIILLLLLLSNGEDNKRRLIDYFPSNYKLQIWPLDSTTYKIQPIEKENDVSTDRNDSIVFTVEDFRNLVISEVNNHLKSEDQKRLPSPPADQLELFIRNVINDEVKNMLKKLNFRPDSRDSRLHRSLRGEEMLEIIRKEASQVVKAELLKYSQDKLNKPDFALHSGGAKVISKFTSKTYELWPDKWYQKAFAYLSGQGILRGKPPVTAIKHDTNVGECWPFPGKEGQLAVLLNRRVYVTAVTYDHVSKDIAVDIYSAPKEFEVWGIIDDGTGGKTNNDEEDLDLDRTYDMESTEDTCGPREDGEYVPGKNNNLPNGDNLNNNNNDGGGGLSYWSPPLENLTKGELHLGSSPLHLFLGRFTYEIDGLPVQTFEIPQNIQKSNKPIRAIIMRINNNWGKSDYTCLYRFRVHGEPA